MANSTRWEDDYDARTLESVDAAAQVALEPSPRVWPISGDGATTWNPSGYPLLKKKPPKRFVDPDLHDERTPELPKRHL